MQSRSLWFTAQCLALLASASMARAAVQCSFSVSPPSLSVGVAGASGRLTITASDAGCGWAVIPSKPFINILSPLTGSGNGSVSYTIQPNTLAAPLMGAITVQGPNLLVQVMQDGRNPEPAFADVAPGYPFFDWIQFMAANKITGGCGTAPLVFCPETPAARGQLAVFLVRSMLGDTFTSQQTPYYTDVPASHPFFRYIQKLKELNLGQECAPQQFCPESAATRGLAAQWIVQAKFGNTPAYPATPYFTDVTAADPLFPFVQTFRQLGYTIGCGGTLFCPNNPARRGELSVFLIRAFFAE